MTPCVSLRISQWITFVIMRYDQKQKGNLGSSGLQSSRLAAVSMLEEAQGGLLEMAEGTQCSMAVRRECRFLSFEEGFHIQRSG